MRDYLLMGVFIACLPFAIRHTYAAVLLWTWIGIMNPHKLAWGFALNFPFAAGAAGVALLSMVFTKDRISMPKSPALITLIILIIWMCLTTAFAFHPDGSFEQLKKVLKIQLMTLVALAALQERKHIELFIWVNAISLGFYGFKGGLFTIATGGSSRVWGPSGGFIEGNNEIGLALVMSIPLMNYLRAVSVRPVIRNGLLILMFLSAVAALGTQSRGAFLAIGAMGFVLWMRSDKKFASGIIILFAAAALLAFMPDAWEQRMRSIQNYEQDTSAMGRINAWWFTVNIANSRLLGGGFDIYTPDLFAFYAPNPLDIHVAHSIYFSILGEHGYVGLFLFLLIWVLAFKIAQNIRREAGSRPETKWAFYLAGMCQVSLVGYAVGGAFLSLAYFDLPYNILIVLIVLQRWLKEKRWETEHEGAFGASTLSEQKPTRSKVMASG